MTELIIILALIGYSVFKDIQYKKQITDLQELIYYKGEKPIKESEEPEEPQEDLDNFIPLDEADPERLLKALKKEE